MNIKRFILCLGLTLIAAIYPYKPLLAENVKTINEFAEETATIAAIDKVLPAVVSITITKRVPQNINGVITTQKIVVGSGTGFVISSDGLILTNRHVVNQKEQGEYRIHFQSGKNYYAQFIGVDPLNDLAILKIFDKNLPIVQLGDSDKLHLGSTVIAIGNALGRYQNSATKGIVSGIGRNLYASDDEGDETNLTNVIQTDAQINPGNSGGPLINLKGEVVGINVAIDTSGDAIGFAIPINDAKSVITSVKQTGRIIRPRLGVNYIMLNEDLAAENNLPVTQGAWLVDSPDQPAIMPNSPAQKAGLQANDIILEINAQPLNEQLSLTQKIQQYRPGQTIGLRVLRGGRQLIIEVTLDEFL